MERPSPSMSNELADLRVEVAELSRDLHWHHQAVMERLRALEMAPRTALASPDLLRFASLLAALALPLLVFAVTGSPETAVRATNMLPR